MGTTFPIAPVLLVVLATLIFVPGAHAFGAGEIPDYAYLADKAFRHGDLENTLKELNKIVRGGHGGGGGFNFGGGGAAGILGGIAGGLLSAAASSGGGTKFSSMDVKRVYLGNFLCDYSQCMDIAGLTKLTADSLLTIVMALGFMTFGFATEEFQVTKERLGCYLCTTHIDNPKGYGEGYDDPREVYPELRPPVEPEELELNEENGMKNYIATEGRQYDTSTALLKRVFRECIEHGRRAGGRDGPELYEAFRLLGQGLHTCEDLLAHSNWCEIMLRKLGHQDVFCHVGDNVTVNSPHGPVPPLVTGTFGSADFLFSLLGEATDHLSEASLTDLTKRLDSAKNTDQSDSPLSKLTKLFKMIPMGGGGDTENKMQQGEEMKAQAVDLNARIDSVAPEELQEQLWAILKWRDGLMKDISDIIQHIPGLEDLLDQITEALNVYVFTILEPFMTPILQNATGVLQGGSSAVIESNHENQYEVFDDPNASDPSHSLLSKDHFALILNEPAGLVAIVVVKHVVNAVVQAWYDESDIDQVIESVLEVFHHPYYSTGRSQVQRDMKDALRRWIEGMAEEDREIVLRNLTKEAVRDGKNKRAGHEDDDTTSHGHASVPAYNAGLGRSTYGGGPGSGAEPKGNRYQGQQQQQPSSDDYGYGGGQTQTPAYNRQRGGGEYGSGGGRQQRNDYGGGGGGGGDYYGSQPQQTSYEQPERESRQTYGRQQQQDDYGYNLGGRTEDSSYGSRREPERRQEPASEGWMGRRNDEGESYGSRQTGNEYGSGGGYGERAEGGERYYGGGGDDGEQEHHKKHHKKHHEDAEESSYGYGGQNESSYGGGDRAGGGEQYGFSRGEPQRQTVGGWNTGESEGYGGGYGRREQEQESYRQPRNEEEYGYNGGGGRQEYGGEGRRQRDEDETFGAERLNLNENEEGGERRRDYYESQY